METETGYYTYYVCVLTNKHRTVMYTGVTNNLSVRLHQHRSKLNPNSFTSKYNCFYLIYYEKFTWIQEAIAREKEIKLMKRITKLTLIRNTNPNLQFLNNDFTQSFNI